MTTLICIAWITGYITIAALLHKVMLNFLGFKDDDVGVVLGPAFWPVFVVPLTVLCGLPRLISWVRGLSSSPLGNPLIASMAKATKNNNPSDVLIGLVLQKMAMTPERITGFKTYSWSSPKGSKIRIWAYFNYNVWNERVETGTLQVNGVDITLSEKQWKTFYKKVEGLKKIGDEKKKAAAVADLEHKALDAVTALLGIQEKAPALEDLTKGHIVTDVQGVQLTPIKEKTK